MPILAHRLRLVDSLDDTRAAAVLAEALEFADASECAPIAAALLERPINQEFALILRRWSDLDEPTRQSAFAAAACLPAVLRKCAAAGLGPERRQAIEIIGRLGLSAESPVILDALANEDANIVRTAAQALDRLAAAGSETLPAAAGSVAAPPAGDPLDEAIASALDAWPRHRQDAVLVAAARMLSAPGPALSKWLADRAHPTHLALRGFMKRVPDAELAPMLLTWLGLDVLASQALEHIARLALTPHFALLVGGREHLLLRPEQSARLKRLDPRRPAAPPSSVVHEMDDRAQAALPAWLLAVPMSDEERILRLADGLAFRSPRARLAALRALVSLDEARADEIVARFAFDEDERLARLAAQHCIRRNVPGLDPLLDRLLTSPHRALRLLAASHGRPADFEGLWSHWSGRGPGESQRLEARLALRNDRSAFVVEVRRRLRDAQRDTALRAIRMADDLDLLPDVELELLALAASDEARLSATAIKALGRVQSESAGAAVLAALRHRDARTRANAIEVLATSLIEQHRPVIEAIAGGSENRPRANAIAALAKIDRGGAASRLEAMLDDARPLHRLSALWAAEITVLTPCATRVAQLAQHDPSPPVRERARRTARRLLAAMSHQPPVTRSVDGLRAAGVTGATAAPSAARPSISMLSIAPLTLGAWPELSWEWIAPSLAALAVVGATVGALRLSLNDAARLGPAYRTLARGLGLTRRERRLLHVVAMRAGRPHASGMLISRGAFDHHVATWRQQSGDADEAARDRLAAIRARLFD